MCECVHFQAQEGVLVTVNTVLLADFKLLSFVFSFGLKGFLKVGLCDLDFGLLYISDVVVVFAVCIAITLRTRILCLEQLQLKGRKGKKIIWYFSQ